MASEEIHLKQAKHNEDLANKLSRFPPYHDWAITSAFYASVHYFEGWLYRQHTRECDRHTETSVPISAKDGKRDCSPHTWRERVVRERFKREAYNAFRELRTSSEFSRYLSFCQLNCKNSPASEYFSEEDAIRISGEVLNTFKRAPTLISYVSCLSQPTFSSILV